MDVLEIALPAALLVLAFLLKLLVDRRTSLVYFIEATLELPVEIAFLATSFVVAFTISTPLRVKEGLLMFTIYIIGCIMVVFLWRRSLTSLEKDRLHLSFTLVVANYFTCLTGLVVAVRKLIGR